MSSVLKKQTEGRTLLEPKLKGRWREGFLWRNVWLCFEMVLIEEEQSLWELKRVQGDGECREEAINIKFKTIMRGGEFGTWNSVCKRSTLSFFSPFDDVHSSRRQSSQEIRLVSVTTLRLY